MSKYDLLTAALAERDGARVVLSFDELDTIVGGLPDSARTYPEWWTNNEKSQPHARGWLRAGWSASPDFGREVAVFTRDRGGGTWIFQGNPKTFDVEGAVEALDRMTWSVRQHGDAIHVGDRVYVWVAGTNAGVVATATVVDAPIVQPGDPGTQRFVRDADELAGEELRATIRIDRRLHDARVTRTELKGLAELQGLPILVQPAATNFIVTPEETAVIDGLIEGRLGRRILKVAPGKQGAIWDVCTAEGVIAVGWNELADLKSFESEEELRAAYEEILGDRQNAGTITRESARLWVLRNLQPGDVIVANRGRSEVLGIGQVKPPGYEYQSDRGDFPHIVHVEWDESKTGAIRDQGGTWQSTIAEVSPEQYASILRDLAGGPPPMQSQKRTLSWLVSHTLWEEGPLTELIDALRSENPQIVLAGPPGTGKTWVARHLARYLVEDAPGAHRTVQFHPSFGYEEFIEGLRPLARDGGIHFERVDGVVLEMARGMVDGDERVLIIDEMNRANLPRVFGELMYLFEYRDEPITLQYTPSFQLPAGLKFIGTMNTADRSIRSIDIALRRRFDVFECAPDPGILERFYARPGYTNDVPGLIQGMNELNDRLEKGLDRHHTIGQTFFMAQHMTAVRLRAVWRRKLRPLIEEYFFDQPDTWKEYRFEEFWPGDAPD